MPASIGDIIEFNLVHPVTIPANTDVVVRLLFKFTIDDTEPIEFSGFIDNDSWWSITQLTAVRRC